MTKRTFIMPLIALCTGLAVGLFILATKRFVAAQLMSLLEKEVKASCDCSLAYDSVDVSLLTLSARGRNVRITEDGENRLFMTRVEADFDLSQIRQRKVSLSELRLIDGYAIGIGPSSATYKFVDWLVEPIAPEKDLPGRWKIKLQRLKLTKGKFWEKRQAGRLQGNGVSLDLERTASNDFQLRPLVEELSLYLPSRPAGRAGRIVPLGRTSADMFIADDYIDFRELELALGATNLQVKGKSHTSEQNRLEGEAVYEFDSRSFAFAHWLEAALQGSAILQGSIEAPKLSGNFFNQENRQFAIKGPQDIALHFDKLRADYTLKVEDALLLLTLDSFNAEGSQISVSLREPVRLRDGLLSGVFTIHSDGIELGGMRAVEFAGDILLGGSFSEPAITLRCNAGLLKTPLFDLDNVNFSAEYTTKTLDFSINRDSPESGSLALHGQVQLDDSISNGGPAQLDKLDFKINQLPLTFPPQTVLNASGSLSGQLDAAALSGLAAMSITAPSGPESLRLNGEASLNNGILDAALRNSDQSLNAGLNLKLTGERQGSLNLSLRNFEPFPPESPIQGQRCVVLSSQGNYSFQLPEFRRGDGALIVEKLSIGCLPYQLELARSATLPIKNGELIIPNLAFGTKLAMLQVDGAVSLTEGYRVGVSGDLEIETLLPFFPSLDDLRGRLTLAGQIGGRLIEPVFSGRAALKEAGFDISAEDLSVQNLEGDFEFDNRIIRITGLEGRFNEGRLRVEGLINPSNLGASSLQSQLNDVLWEFMEDVPVAFSGKLSLAADQEGNPVLSGHIIIDSASLERRIDWTSLLKALTQSIFSRRDKEQTRLRLSASPDLPLNITLSAPGNLLFTSNLAAAELQADLRLAGTLAQPLLQGKLETISGWFGVRDRRFEITSGLLLFEPGDFEPKLDVVGETVIRSRDGTSALVILELAGPLSDPLIKLSSDRGLSEREILTLLTSSTDFTLQSRMGTLSQQVALQPIPWSEDQPVLGLGGFLHRLTKIDSLALEPTFNVERGVFEPTVVARKQLLENLEIIAESSYGTGPGESRIRAIYELTPDLKLIGIADAATTEQNAALEGNLVYTILSDQTRFLDIDLDGNWSVPNSELMEEMRLHPSSRVSSGDSPELRLRAQTAYQKFGFFQPSIQVNCRDYGEANLPYCRKLSIVIEEGKPAMIARIDFTGDALPPEIDFSDLKGTPKRTIASDEFRRNLLQGLLNRLRNEGYISARLEAAYALEQSGLAAVLTVHVRLGRPVTFVFNGNRVFSAQDFLETINLFGRRQPFGNNTINILVRNIDLMYREAGYLFAAVGYARSEDQSSDRLLFNIQIDEGPRVTVKEVRCVGNQAMSLDEIKRAVRESSPQEYQAIFSPKYAIAEDIEANLAIIAAVYLESGYADAKIAYQITPFEERGSVAIEYRIEEGQVQRKEWIEIKGWPDNVSLPPEPAAPYSVPKTNRYIQRLIAILNEDGFLTPAVSSVINPETDRLTLHFAPGPRTIISAIRVEGNVNVATSTIERALLVKTGDAWRTEDIAESRRRLLKRGLFSRVDMEPLDGELSGPAEELLVKVSEREMSSLEIGAGLNSEYGLHLFGQATDRSFFADGRSLGLRLDAYYDRVNADISQGIASFTYSDPNFLSSDYGLAEDLRFQRMDLPTYEFDLDRISLASYIHRTLNHHFSGSLGHTILVENLKDVPSDAVLSDLDSGTVRLSFLSSTFNYDARDNPLNPRSGWNLSTDAQLSWEAIGSEANYYGVGAKLSYLQPLPLFDRRLSMAASLRSASAWTFAGTSDVPISQRYYLGGRSSVRGFRENSLGPRGEEGSVIGGDLLIAQNFELRYLIADALSCHLFFDSGGLFLKDQDMNRSGIRESVGAGARYLSPIGPIGVDIGFPLDEQSGEPSFRIHFEIGTNF